MKVHIGNYLIKIVGISEVLKQHRITLTLFKTPIATNCPPRVELIKQGPIQKYLKSIDQYSRMDGKEKRCQKRSTKIITVN